MNTEKNPTAGCCPYCCSPVGNIREYHPFSSDAGAYFVCITCGAEFEPDEYEGLLAESLAESEEE